MATINQVQAAFPVGSQVFAMDMNDRMRPGEIALYTLDGDEMRRPLSHGIRVRFENGELASYSLSDVDLDNPSNSLIVKRNG